MKKYYVDFMRQSTVRNKIMIEKRFSILVRYSDDKQSRNRLYVDLNVPPGDLPYYAICKYDEDNDILSGELYYSGEEPTEKYYLDNEEQMSGIFGKNSGRLYQYEILKFSVNKDASKLIPHFPLKSKRFLNNCRNAQDLLSQIYKLF